MRVRIVTKQLVTEYCDAIIEVPDSVLHKEGAIGIAEFCEENSHMSEYQGVRCRDEVGGVELHRIRETDEQ